MRKVISVFSFFIIVCLWLLSLYLLFSYKQVKNVASLTHISSVAQVSPTISVLPAPRKVLGVAKIVLSPMPKIYIAPVDNKKAFIMNAINNYRSTKGLSGVVTNSSTCALANTRAIEISTDFSHKGFEDRISSHSLPYPNYSLVTENIAETEDYTQVVNLWINSAPHAANMRADTPYVCVENYGNFYAYEGWKAL